MPTILTDGTTVPVISASEWWGRLGQIANRELTREEKDRANVMSAHNWTLRVVAEELFGAAVVDEFFGG